MRLDSVQYSFRYGDDTKTPNTLLSYLCPIRYSPEAHANFIWVEFASYSEDKMPMAFPPGELHGSSRGNLLVEVSWD